MPPNFKFLNVLSNHRQVLFCPTQVPLRVQRQGSSPLHVAEAGKQQKHTLRESSLSGNRLVK